MTTTKISKGKYQVEMNGELYLLNTMVSNGIVRCWSIKKNGERVASCRTKKNALLFLKTNNWWYTHDKA